MIKFIKKIFKKIKDFKEFKQLSKTYNEIAKDPSSYEVLKQIKEEINRMAKARDAKKALVESPFDYSLLEEIAKATDRDIVIQMRSGEVITIRGARYDFEKYNIDKIIDNGRVI